jgi:hypothetical protein
MDKLQQQLHMNLEYAKGIEEQQEEEHQQMHVTLVQGVALPNNRGVVHANVGQNVTPHNPT